MCADCLRNNNKQSCLHSLRYRDKKSTCTCTMEIKGPCMSQSCVVWVTIVYTTVILALSSWQYYYTYTLKQQYQFEAQVLATLEDECLGERTADYDGMLKELLAFMINSGDNTISADHTSGERRARQMTSLESMFQQLLTMQENILEQHCSSNSSICVHGLKGQPGVKGDKGAQGLQGDQGPSGQTGEVGLPGSEGQQGEKGKSGPQGPKGDIGPQGPPGLTGDRGAKGEKGTKGERGIRGNIGTKGGPGDTGLKGETGDPGIKGLKGDSGPPGTKGEIGDKGEKGERGPKGDIGSMSRQDCLCNLNLKGSDKVPVKTKDFTMNCTGASGYITWIKDNKPLVSRLHVSRDNKHVTIPDVLPMDAGNYSCYSNGKLISSYLLSVDGITQYDCDFNNRSLCLWHQTTSGDNFDWLINTGSTTSVATGPNSDHTTENGQYIYIETSTHNRGDFAELVSPSMSGNQNRCLTLWYHMYGSEIYKLEIGIKRGGTFTALRTITGDKGAVWHRIDVDIRSTSNYQIAIRGFKGTSYHGDISVDDIIVTNGICT